jgi:hypothetical protein
MCIKIAKVAKKSIMKLIYPKTLKGEKQYQDALKHHDTNKYLELKILGDESSSDNTMVYIDDEHLGGENADQKEAAVPEPCEGQVGKHGFLDIKRDAGNGENYCQASRELVQDKVTDWD